MAGRLGATLGLLIVSIYVFSEAKKMFFSPSTHWDDYIVPILLAAICAFPCFCGVICTSCCGILSFNDKQTIAKRAEMDTYSNGLRIEGERLFQHFHDNKIIDLAIRWDDSRVIDNVLNIVNHARTRIISRISELDFLLEREEKKRDHHVIDIFEGEREEKDEVSETAALVEGNSEAYHSFNRR